MTQINADEVSCRKSVFIGVHLWLTPPNCRSQAEDQPRVSNAKERSRDTYGEIAQGDKHDLSQPKPAHTAASAFGDRWKP
jgi:hypothetical protein